MTRDDIIKMAKEAGASFETAESMFKFATLVAAAEREACARVCDVLSVHPKYASDITKLAAQAIRARSEL
jgi:hypothetical protein